MRGTTTREEAKVSVDSSVAMSGRGEGGFYRAVRRGTGELSCSAAAVGGSNADSFGRGGVRAAVLEGEE
jgi:hypothetical protein